MAGAGQVNSTFSTYDDNSKREVLSDMIDNITPAETPFYSLIGDEKVTGVNPTWQTESLGTPDADNAHVEGEIYTFETISPTARVSNPTQIFHKNFIVSGTDEVVDKAGKKSTVNHELLKKGKEIRIDIETVMLSNQASVIGSDAIPRRMGGFRAWLSTNDLLGAGGASGGFDPNTGIVNAAVNGTKRAFTKSLMDAAVAAGYTSGGDLEVIMGSPYVKSVFSTFMSDANIAQLRQNTNSRTQATLVGAADAYVSDFGLLDFVPNRQMARTPALARNVFFIDPKKVSKGWLRRIQEDKEVAKTSDGIPKVMLGEVTLIVKNEAAHAVVADINGLTAAS